MNEKIIFKKKKFVRLLFGPPVKILLYIYIYIIFISILISLIDFKTKFCISMVAVCLFVFFLLNLYDCYLVLPSKYLYIIFVRNILRYFNCVIQYIITVLFIY